MSKGIMINGLSNQIGNAYVVSLNEDMYSIEIPCDTPQNINHFLLLADNSTLHTTKRKIIGGGIGGINMFNVVNTNGSFDYYSNYASITKSESSVTLSTDTRAIFSANTTYYISLFE